MTRLIEDVDLDYCVRLMLRLGCSARECKEEAAIYFTADLAVDQIMGDAEYQNLTTLFLRATFQRTMTRLIAEGIKPDVIVEEMGKTAEQQFNRMLSGISFEDYEAEAEKALRSTLPAKEDGDGND
jgi:hypothetical protein